MNIEIKPGKWRMRNGECAVVEFRTEANTRWRWRGYMEADKMLTAWTDEGTYYDRDGGSHSADLIEPWTDKPVVNWSAMPAWAKWVAMEKDGRWFWYTHKPLTDANGHLLDAGWCHGITKEFAPSYTGNWRDSLVERPAA